MPLSTSRVTWFTRSIRACIDLKSGIADRTIRPMNTSSIGMATKTTVDSDTLSRSAMMMPPIIIMGASRMTLSIINTTICTCCTSLVVRVISDGVPKRLTSACEKLSTWRKSAAAQIATEPHRDPGAVVDGDDGGEDEDERDGEHDGAGTQDVGRVARDDAVVDDVGVERRQGEAGDRLDEDQDDDEDDPPPVGAQALAQEAYHGVASSCAPASASARERLELRSSSSRASSTRSS